MEDHLDQVKILDRKVEVLSSSTMESRLQTGKKKKKKKKRLLRNLVVLSDDCR